MVTSTERPARPRSLERGPFAATLALTVVLAVAAFAVAMPLVMLAIRPTQLPAPFAAQNQDAETLAYLLAYVAILPLALVAGARIARAIAAGPNGGALAALAALLAALLGAAILAVRLSGAAGIGDGVAAVLAAAALWWAVAAAILARALRPRAWPPLLRLAGAAARLWALAGVLGLGTLLCMTDLGSISVPALLLGAAAAAAATFAYERLRPPRLARPWGAAADAALVGLLLLAVPDLVIFRPEEAVGNAAVALETSVIQFHQNFLLGPANEVLGGHPMLADTASQYGVGSLYLLAGWFTLAPIGYGTLGFLTGALTALWFAAGYGVLRIAGTSRTLSASACALAVVALIFNLAYPVGALPQSGPLRFGLPMALILMLAAGERWPARSRAALVAALAIVGLSAIWSLEALAYTAAAFVAIGALQAWSLPAPGRIRWLVRRLALGALACAVAHALFALATLAAAGRLPDWGHYLAYLREFLFGDLGDLTYDVPRWTPGLAVGAALLASAAAIVELARRRDALLERERPALVALAGMTAYGIALMSYYVDRSLGHILIHVALPALLTCALWLGLLLRSRATVPRAARSGGLAFALATAALVAAVAWSSVGERLPRSALVHALPRNVSLGAALDRLWDPPPLDATATAGERQLARHMPGERRSIVMVAPDVGTEILVRSGRADRLELGAPWEASFVAEEHLPHLRAAVEGLRPGDRMLMDDGARDLAALFRDRPGVSPLELGPPRLAPLQRTALRWIEERFRLRPVASELGGFSVVELALRA